MSYITGSLDPITLFIECLRARVEKRRAKEKVHAFVSPIVWKRVVMSRGWANNFSIR